MEHRRAQPPDRLDVIATDRRRGYRTAMRRHGLDAHIRVLRGDHTEAAGERAARRLLDAGDLPAAG